MKYIYILVITSIIFHSCINIHPKKYIINESKKIRECRESWNFYNLDSTLSVKVLYFDPSHNFCSNRFPNFLIGQTVKNEIIAIIDKSFEGDIKIDEKVIISPSNWNELERRFVQPAFIISKRKKINDLQCKVKSVYYGNIYK